MNKFLIFGLLAVCISGSVRASSSTFPRPEFDSLKTDGQVAIDDSKVNENADAKADAQDDTQGDTAKIQSVASATSDESDLKTSDPSSQTSSSGSAGFSVRLLHIYGGKKSIAKKNRSAGSSVIENYTIQISSHLTEADAKMALQELQKVKGSGAWMACAEVAGQVRYRVYVGHYKTMVEAKKARAQVAKESGVREAFVQKVFGKLTAQN